MYRVVVRGTESGRRGTLRENPARACAQATPGPVYATLTLTTYDNPNPTRNGLCP